MSGIRHSNARELLTGLPALIALFVCYLVMTGAAHGAVAEGQKIVRFGLASAPVTLDPRFATDAASTRINRLIYRQLVDFNERFEPVPALARWESVDSKRYRFFLDPERARFHDGTRLTATDVKATYEFVLDETNGSPHRGGLLTIAAIEVQDENTVDFLLTQGDALFPGRLVIGILPKSQIDIGRAFNREPVGSGPFRFVDWPIEDRLRIQRQTDGLVVEFVRVPKPTVRVLKLVRGELDMIQGDLPHELVGWLRGRKEVKVESTRGTTFAYIGFNLDDPVTRKPEIRRAVAMAINRQAIIQYVLGASARPASAILPPDHWAGHPQLPIIAYDPEGAKSLLRKAGFASNELRLIYKTSNDPFRVRLATIIQDQLARVGVVVELRTYDWGTFYGDVKAGNFQMYSLAWVGIKMPDIFRYVFHSQSVPPVGANRGRFLSAAADDLIEQAERSEDLSDQAYFYRELQALVLRELPYVPLWYEDQVFASRRDIKGYAVASDGNYDGLVSLRAEKLR